jgi:hypothetical protein
MGVTGVEGVEGVEDLLGDVDCDSIECGALEALMAKLIVTLYFLASFPVEYWEICDLPLVSRSCL